MPPVKFVFKPRYVGDVEALGYHPSLPLGLRHRILEQGIKVFGTVQIYYVLIGNSKKYKMRNPKLAKQLHADALWVGSQ